MIFRRFASMNIDVIMEKLEKDRIWSSDGQDTPKLERCVFCGGEGMIVALNPMYGLCGTWVRCCSCGACGPRASIYAQITKPGNILSWPLLPESLERGITAAVDAWNTRTVDLSRMGNLKLDARRAAV